MAAGAGGGPAAIPVLKQPRRVTIYGMSSDKRQALTTPSTAKTETASNTGEEFEVLLIYDDLEPGHAVLFPTLPGCYA